MGKQLPRYQPRNRASPDADASETPRIWGKLAGDWIVAVPPHECVPGLLARYLAGQSRERPPSRSIKQNNHETAGEKPAIRLSPPYLALIFLYSLASRRGANQPVKRSCLISFVIVSTSPTSMSPRCNSMPTARAQLTHLLSRC